MTNNTNKEQWIEEVLRSTEGMQRARPQSDMPEQVRRKLANYKENKALPFPVKQWIAAAILLILLNAGSVVYFTVSNHGSKNERSANPLVAEIQTESTYNY